MRFAKFLIITLMFASSFFIAIGVLGILQINAPDSSAYKLLTTLPLFLALSLEDLSTLETISFFALTCVAGIYAAVIKEWIRRYPARFY